MKKEKLSVTPIIPMVFCVESASTTADIGLGSVKEIIYCDAFIETSKYLKLTKKEMARRHKMGIEAAKLLIPTTGCRELTPEEKKAGRKILPVEDKIKKYAQ